MATVGQKGETKRGGQTATRQTVPITMAAGATADVTFTIPAGASFVRFQWATAVAFTGSPTNIYLTVGKTSGGQDYVANTDVKSQTAPTAATLVAASTADLMSAPGGQTWHATLTANGGTNPAGTCYLLVEYAAPSAIA